MIKRYLLYNGNAEPRLDGNWVRYEDYVHEVGKITDECDGWKNGQEKISALETANEIANNTIALMAKQVTKLTDERDKAIREIGIWSRKAGKLEAENEYFKTLWGR